MTVPEEAFAGHIEVVGRNVLVTPAMKQHALEKLTKVGKFQDHILDIHMTMDIEHLDHKVSLVVKFDHFKVKAEAHSNDMYVSIDQAIARVEKQLKRWKEQIHDHTRKKRAMVDVEVSILEKPYSDVDEYNDAIDEANAKIVPSFTLGKIAGKKSIKIKELTVEEAIMKIELSNDDFLVYRSEEDRKLKVLYRRKDGNYGLIQTE